MDNRHVIEQAVFDIRFGSEEQAFAQQGDMGAYIKDGLLLVIDEVFMELSEPGLVFRFDRLEIDLGLVGYDTHRNEWKRRLREQLQSALATQLVPVGRERGGALQGVITRRQSELQRLQFFLERGYMPWHAEQPDSLVLDELLLRVLQNDSDRLLEFIRNADNKEMVLNRIVNQFSATVLTGLVRMIRAYSGNLPAELLQIVEQEMPVETNAAPNDAVEATQMTQLRRRIADALLAGDATGIRAEWPGLCRVYPHVLLHELRGHGRRASVRRKIADGFPETMLKEIVLLLEPGEAPFIEEVAEKPELFRQASSRLQDDGDVIKKRLWEFTLGYLLEERGSLFNRKSYLGSMARRMAAYGTLDIRELLAGMQRVLVNLEVVTPLKNELLEVIDTLAEEAGLESPVAGEDRLKTEEQARMQDLRQRIGRALRHGTPEELAEVWPRLLRDYPQLLIRELWRFGREEAVRRKIAEGFPETMLSEIVLLLEPGEASFIEEVAERPELYLQASSRLQDDGEVIKRRLWEFTLGYLLEERESLFNRKSYLGSMARRMAAYGTIDIRELLAGMHRVLVNLEVVTPLKNELLEVIDALAEEAGPKPPVAGKNQPRTIEQARMGDLQQRIDRALRHGTPEELSEVWPRLLRDYPRLLIRELRRLGREETVRRRIADGFPETMLSEIVLLLEPGEASFIEEALEKPELYRQASSRLQDDGDVIKRRLWEFTLGYLLEERGSLFNRKSYLGSMVRRMAVYGTIDIRELLAGMQRVLVNLDVVTPLKSELLEVIDTLAEEAGLESPVAGEDQPGAVEQERMKDLQQRIGRALRHGTPEKLAEVWPRLLHDYPQLLLRELRRLGREEAVRRSIADSFPKTMLREIVLLLEPVGGDFIEQVVGHRELFRQAGAFTQESGDRGGKRLWEFTLGYQLEERGSRFNKKSYMASLIRQMAAHSNLDSLTLLKSVYQGLVESASTNSLFGELLELIGELVKEEISRPAEEREPPESVPHRGSALAEQLRLWLIRGALPAREGRVTRLLDELAAHHPGQLLRLFNDLRRGDPFQLTVNGSHGAEELHRIIELFLLLVHRVDQEKRTNFLGAIDDWAIRSGDAGRFLGQVFELLLHDQPIDCESLMKEQRGELAKNTAAQAPVDTTSLIWKPDDAVEEISEEIYVTNAGLVLATPYLPRLFTMLELLDTWLFIDAHAAERGVHLLHHLAERGTNAAEPLLVLNKILCGLAPETPVVRELAIDDREKEIVDGMIAGMIANWPVIGATSVDSFRESFLQREGVLRLKDDGWHLLVEPRAYDLLLDQIPWNFSIIKHPWMVQALHVEWRHGL
jgi:allophanate hydrolase subunit 1